MNHLMITYPNYQTVPKYMFGIHNWIGRITHKDWIGLGVGLDWTNDNPI